jgi:hypothetical protein
VQITDYPLNIDNLLVNRQATRLAFSSQVYANLSIKETADRRAAEKASDSLVYKFDKLFIRHWDEYMLGLRHHPFGDGRTQWSFSASGNNFAFTRQYDETSEVAWSTNLDIFTVDLTVTDSKSLCITESKLCS